MADNVEVARRWLEALNSEDFDTALALAHPEIEVVPPGGQARHRGTEGLRRWMEPEAFPGQVIEPVELVAAGDDKVLGKQHVTARGARSGIELEVFSWSVFTFDQDGLIRRFEIYLDYEEDRAREAAGLPRQEGDDSPSA
jgi:ketosteroid isomerase-like protein